MSCTRPLKAFYRINPGTKKKDIIFSNSSSKLGVSKDGILYPNPIDIPCGQCAGCRLDYARNWSVRCMLESLQYEHNYFVTLTYDDEHLSKENIVSYVPCNLDTGEVITTSDGDIILSHSATLVKAHLTQFMKSLREYFQRVYNHTGIRFFACGEYGSKTMRPHFHLILFNCPIPDLELYKTNFQGDTYWFSDILQHKIWKRGIVVVAKCNYNTCSYVARYMLKKQKGKGAEIYHSLHIEPPFSRASRMPGIARNYYDSNSVKIYKYDSLYIVDGNGKSKKVRPPHYFDRLYDIDNPDELNAIKEKRKNIAVRSFQKKLTTTDMSEQDYLAILDERTEGNAFKLLRPL